jgi:hypothetical protein
MGGGRHESLCSANPMNTIPPAKRSNEEKQHITEAKRTKNPKYNELFKTVAPKSTSTLMKMCQDNITVTWCSQSCDSDEENKGAQ